MRLDIRSPFRWGGHLSRRNYFLAGLVLLGVKHALDRLVIRTLFGESWSFWSYLEPLTTVPDPLRARSLTPYLFLLLLSLPFAWAGCALTVRRLRDAGLPLSLALLFFVPFLKFGLFLFLILMPTAAVYGSKRFASPPSSLETGLFATLLVAGPILLVLFSTKVLESYGWGLFVALPFFMGFAAAMMASRRRELTMGKMIGVANLSIVAFGVLLLCFAMEGLLCLAMAAPIAFPLASLGGMVAYQVQSLRGRWKPATPGLLGILLLFPPALAFEKAALPPPPIFSVRTSVVVNAPPEAVWRHVVAFSEIPAPREWIFRAGVAYPIRASIDGAGPGAIRNCVFSTGAFVEPIEVWDAPHLLRFGVTRNPSPMREWSPYGHIEPEHLHGFLEAQRGQFEIQPRPDGQTLLTGTTWYRHSLWPASYWRLWSDGIIHRIHRRVLDHIRTEADESAGTGEDGTRGIRSGL